MSQQYDPVICNCQSQKYMELVEFVKVPAVMSKNGKSGIAPARSTFVCANCGTDIQMSEAVRSMAEEAKNKSNIIV